jgi:hypothetical protein
MQILKESIFNDRTLKYYIVMLFPGGRSFVEHTLVEHTLREEAVLPCCPIWNLERSEHSVVEISVGLGFAFAAMFILCIAKL